MMIVMKQNLTLGKEEIQLQNLEMNLPLSRSRRCLLRGRGVRDGGGEGGEGDDVGQVQGSQWLQQTSQVSPGSRLQHTDSPSEIT